MRKILYVTLTFTFMKAIFIFPVFASKAHDAFLLERERIINSSKIYEEKQYDLRKQSEAEQVRIQVELSEAAKAWLNANPNLNSQFQGHVETALTLKNGQFKTISFDDAGETTIQKFVDLFQEVPKDFKLSVENLTASTNAIDQNFKLTLIAELSNKQFSSDSIKKLAELWQQYMNAKLSILLFASASNPEKKIDYDLLMAEATAPGNTADLITNLLLQKSTEKLMADAVKDLSVKQRAIARKHALINYFPNNAEAISLRNELVREKENLDKQALSAREQVARTIGYAGIFLDGRIKSILNIEEPLKVLENKETVVKLAKELALSPEVLAVTGTPDVSKKPSEKEIDKLASEPQKSLPQPAAVSDEEESSNITVLRKKIAEKITKATQEEDSDAAWDLWLQIREGVGNLASVSIPGYEKMEKFLELTPKEQMKGVLTPEEQQNFLAEINLFEQTLKPIEDLTIKALRRQVKNAFKGQAFDQFKKDMRSVLVKMEMNKELINLNTLLNNEVFINKMKEISSKIKNKDADEDSKSFVAWWNRHVEANFPVHAAQLIEKLKNPNVKNLTRAAFENSLANAGAKELYLQEREKLNKKSQGQAEINPHREHIQPYVDTATKPMTELGYSIAAEAMVIMMAKQLIDEELTREEESMKSTTNGMLKGNQQDVFFQQLKKMIQKDTIRQLKSLSKQLEEEEKLVLEFWGTLQGLKANTLLLR